MGSMFHSSINIKEFDANLQKLASSFDCGWPQTIVARVRN